MLNTKNKTRSNTHFKVKRLFYGSWCAQKWQNSEGGYKLSCQAQGKTMKEALLLCSSL